MISSRHHHASSPTETDSPARARRLWAAVVAVVTAVCAVGVATTVGGTVSAATVVHVSPSGDDRASGTAGDPVRSIGRAVKIAPDGATVEIDAGTYRESVQVYAKELHLVAVGGRVVLDGARPVTGFSREGAVWVSPWSSDLERTGAPFTTPERPEAGWPDQFFLDGAPLREVTSRSRVVSGTFFVDRSLGQVVLGDDPNGRLVEGSDLTWGLYLNRADGSSLDGLTVRRYATQNREMAAVRAYADDLTVTGVVVEDNARIGLSVMGDAVRLQDVTARRNGHLGIHGHRASGLTISGSTVVGNNAEGFDAKHSAGGVKITTSTGLLVERSVVSDNGGPGVWTDLDVVDAVVRSSRMERNSRSGIEIELSSDVVVVDNVVVGNGEAGIWVLESSSVDVWHNTSLHNVRDVWVEDGNRADLVGVRVVNNVLGGGAPGATAILNVDDWTERRSADDMAVEVDANRYWVHPDSATRHVSRWANWPAPLAMSTTIDQHRAATGGGAGSDVRVARFNPFARSAADLRQPTGAPVARPMPAHVAEAARITGSRAAGAVTDLGRDSSSIGPGTSTVVDPVAPGSGPSTGVTTPTSTTTPTTGGTRSPLDRPMRTPDLRGATLVVETGRPDTSTVALNTDPVTPTDVASAGATGPAASPAPAASPDDRDTVEPVPQGRRPDVVATTDSGVDGEVGTDAQTDRGADSPSQIETASAPAASAGWSARHRAVRDALAGR